jgi:dihydrofolate reductase
MKISLIVAVSQNNVIGRDNQLPWYLPEDLKYFKSVTMGKPLIMGRKTFESIGRPLPGRINIVITRNPSWTAEGIQIAADINTALAMGERACKTNVSDEIMVIGGEQIYRLCIPFAERLYLTRVDASVEGDAFFPKFDMSGWNLVSEKIPKQTENFPYRFLILEKIMVG